MTCSPKLFALAALATAAVWFAPRAVAQDATAQFRFLSTIMRDHLPTSAEAREFQAAANKSAKLDEFIERWFSDADHKARVERHFNDMFGVGPYFFLTDASLDLIPYETANHPEAPSDLTTPGVYHLPKDVKTTCYLPAPLDEPLEVDAWFSDEKILICPTAVSSIVADFDNGINCMDAFSSEGIRNPACGCGPQQIICYPRAEKKFAVLGVTREFANRGYRAYDQGWSWGDTFGGDLFYGDRWLYHHYLHQSRVAVTGLPPTTAQMNFLKALPLDSKAEVSHPAGGPERAGIVTMPAFMTRFNNFRSRVRALSNQLLCNDVDGSLNPDNYATFLNDDLSAFDKAHGDDEGCASCHYGMDNQGSTLLGWSADGYYEAWWAPSQVGHVFGLDGTGPRFLLEGYVERATGFAACMAKKSWEEFTGARWSDLTDAEKTELTNQAALGPRQAIRTVLTSAAAKRLRASPNTTVTTTVPVTLAFATDINPILQASCAGSSCHSDGNGSPRLVYIGNESNFRSAPEGRISNGSMPPAGSGMTLSDADRNKLLIFLGQ